MKPPAGVGRAGKLRAEGRWLFADADSVVSGFSRTRLKWRSIMAFRLLELEAHHPAAADAFLNFAPRIAPSRAS